jgi:hypothetical protein
LPLTPDKNELDETFDNKVPGPGPGIDELTKNIKDNLEV